MKQLVAAASKTLCIAALLGPALAIGQHSRTYKETFQVNPDVEVALNTSYADIEFSTWNKNEVQVEAVVTLEGASEEEAEAYFKEAGVKILGSSSRVEVGTQNDNSWTFRFNQDMDLDFMMPDMPDLGLLLDDLVMPELNELMVLQEMPPMPPIRFENFDYQAYEKEGEAYLNRWKKEFDKQFNAEYKAELEAWSQRAKERAEESLARREAKQAELKAEMEERAKQIEERQKHREEAMRHREEARAQLAEVREQAREEARQREAAPRVFFMRGEGGDRNFTIKKSIRIKMPKNARLKLDVRHGEVKLAENARNMQATLSYARLLASTIDGDNTRVSARYSPIAVKAWNDGTLSADFSEKVELDEVHRLDLTATSSEVTIDRLMREATIRNNLGVLHIHQVAPDFRVMNISVQNGDLQCKLPEGAYQITVNNTASEFSAPSSIVWEPAQKLSGLRKGYRQKKDAGRSIVINASYSDVKLQE